MRSTIVTLSTAAALLALGVTSAQAGTPGARPGATPACGAHCAELSSLLLGPDYIVNAFVPGDHGTGGRAGRKVNLKRASNSHPNEDFLAQVDGTVSQFCGTQLSRTSVACLDYPTAPVYEFNWAPFGNQTGLCAGTSGPLVDGENVTLKACGRFEGTLWIADSNHVSGSYFPLINGADRSFSHPMVLTVAPGSHHPARQLKVERENLLTGGVMRDSQEFTTVAGPAA